MDYKEKYEQALERARQFSEKPYLEDSAGIVEYIFPELKESEDEKIRKWIIENIQETLDVNGFFENQKTMAKKALSWLEKQGEQKPNPCENCGIATNNCQKFPCAIRDGEQKPAENKGMNLVEEEMTPFQKKVFCIIDATIEEEQGLKQVCDELLALASNEIKQNSAWSEEDENKLKVVISFVNSNPAQDPFYDKGCLKDWLKSLRPQNTWKPSESDILLLEMIANGKFNPQDFQASLYSLIEQLNKLKG